MYTVAKYLRTVATSACSSLWYISVEPLCSKHPHSMRFVVFSLSKLLLISLFKLFEIYSATQEFHRPWLQKTEPKYLRNPYRFFRHPATRIPTVWLKMLLRPSSLTQQRYSHNYFYLLIEPRTTSFFNSATLCTLVSMYRLISSKVTFMKGNSIHVE